MGNGKAYRTEWRALWKPDNHTGRLRIEVYYPHKVPVRVTSWRDRVKASGDVLLLAAALACFIAAAVTQ